MVCGHVGFNPDTKKTESLVYDTKENTLFKVSKGAPQVSTNPPTTLQNYWPQSPRVVVNVHRFSKQWPQSPQLRRRLSSKTMAAITSMVAGDP